MNLRELSGKLLRPTQEVAEPQEIVEIEAGLWIQENIMTTSSQTDDATVLAQ